MKQKTALILIGIATMATSCTMVHPMVTDNEAVKTGVAKGTAILGFGNIDVSITRAAENGKISKIATVETVYQNAIFYTKAKTTVTGN